MRADLFTLWTLLGLAAGHAIERRDDPDDDSSKDDKGDDKKPWHPKTKDPHFFNLKVDSRCSSDAQQPDTSGGSCKLEGYAIRLEKGIMIATPYNKWWDPKLPTFFVDDDTSTYTVSKEPLQIFIDAVTGAVKYTKVGWLPPSSISVSFYHTGNNPLGLIDPSPSYWTWPSTYNIAFYGEWWFCPLGETGQYQVFVNNQNFDSSGVQKEYCESLRIAAVNANPWKKPPHPPAPPPPPKDGSYGGGDDGNW